MQDEVAALAYLLDSSCHFEVAPFFCATSDRTAHTFCRLPCQYLEEDERSRECMVHYLCKSP